MLFAGAGMSLSAGLSSARGIIELLVGKLHADPGYPSATALEMPLQVVAGDFDRRYGREKLTKVFQSALGGLNLPPTAAHRLDVRLFPLIFTSNLDILFELAREAEGGPIT